MDNVTIIDTCAGFNFYFAGECIGSIAEKFNGYGWLNAHIINEDGFYNHVSCDTWEGAYTVIMENAGFSPEDELFWPIFESVFTYSEDD